MLMLPFTARIISNTQGQLQSISLFPYQRPIVLLCNSARNPHYNIPMKDAIPRSAYPSEHGRYKPNMRDLLLLAPLPVYATSPDFANVTVALGTIVMVFVIVIGVPPMPFVVSLPDSCAEAVTGMELEELMVAEPIWFVGVLAVHVFNKGTLGMLIDWHNSYK
jgi:hypothetical protein